MLGQTPFPTVKITVECRIRPHGRNSPAYTSTALVIACDSDSL